MLFSVVIPLYNKADTIERTIRSVWEQTYTSYELIVVNDGSTDGSLDVVNQLSVEGPIIIIDKPNGGVSSARNAGARVASGEYIALLDGDDVWYPNHLTMLSDAIAKHPNIKFFGTGYERFSGAYVYFTIPWGGYRVKDVYSAFRYGQPINTSTVAVERDLWVKTGGFDERYSFYEDYDFFFRLGVRTKCCIVRKISCAYRDDAIESATKKRRAVSRRTRPHILALEKVLKECRVIPGVDKYVSTYVKLAWAYMVLDKSNIEYEFLLKDCPNIAHIWRADSSLIGPKVQASLIRLNYRIRNHFIIWRRAK